MKLKVKHVREGLLYHAPESGEWLYDPGTYPADLVPQDDWPARPEKMEHGKWILRHPSGKMSRCSPDDARLQTYVDEGDVVFAREIKTRIDGTLRRNFEASMKSVELSVTLQFPVTIRCGFDVLSDLREEIDRHLRHWSDGRYHFSTEMVMHGLEQVVESAVRDSVETTTRKMFGDEMVQVGPRSQSSRAHLEAEKFLRDLSVRCYHDGRAISAAVVDTELELEGTTKWRVLCRDDRKPDGSPGDYAMSSRVFDDADAARAHAICISPSRFPLVVEADKADAVLGALNLKRAR
jgi:hypothetical protein